MNEPDEDFLMRQITTTSEDYPQIKVARMRTTKQANTITLSVGNQSITFNGAADEMGDHYEMMARDAADLLEHITLNPCKLPKEL